MKVVANVYLGDMATTLRTMRVLRETSDAQSDQTLGAAEGVVGKRLIDAAALAVSCSQFSISKKLAQDELDYYTQLVDGSIL